MSHAPQLMLNPDNWHLLNTRQGEHLPDKPGLEKETQEVKWAKWNGCMEAIGKLREKIATFNPDVLVVVGDDQHENLVDDNMPPFTIFMGEEVEASLSLRYLNQPKSENRTKYRVATKIAEGLVNGLMDEGFDPSYSQENPLRRRAGPCLRARAQVREPAGQARRIPVMVNTYYPPAPSAQRCVHFGRALANVLRRIPGDQRVVVVGSGGLSHTKIDEQLDAWIYSGAASKTI